MKSENVLLLESLAKQYPSIISDRLLAVAHDLQVKDKTIELLARRIKEQAKYSGPIEKIIDMTTASANSLLGVKKEECLSRA